MQLIGRASGKVLGEKGIILVEGNPAAGWVKDRYKDQTQAVFVRTNSYSQGGTGAKEEPAAQALPLSSLLWRATERRYHIAVWNSGGAL